MKGQHERDRSLSMALRLDDGKDADPGRAQSARDLRQHARTVLDAEPQIEFGNRIRHRLALAVEVVGREPAGPAERGQHGRRLGQVAEDRARRRILPGPAPVE